MPIRIGIGGGKNTAVFLEQRLCAAGILHQCVVVIGGALSGFSLCPPARRLPVHVVGVIGDLDPSGIRQQGNIGPGQMGVGRIGVGLLRKLLGIGANDGDDRLHIVLLEQR